MSLEPYGGNLVVGMPTVAAGEEDVYIEEVQESDPQFLAEVIDRVVGDSS